MINECQFQTCAEESIGEATVNILVIGNGFDLAHHLPTQYSNFLDFIKAYKKSDDSEYSRFIDEIKDNNVVVYKEIGTLIENNVLLNYFLSIYEDRCKEGKNGWIDFESEISSIVQKLDEAKQYVEREYSTSGKPVKLERGLAINLKPIIDMTVDHLPNTNAGVSRYKPHVFDDQANRVLQSLNKLIRLLEIYLHEYVEKLDCKYRIRDLNGRSIDRVLSFNYTDTYKKFYDPDGTARYCFIHGKAQTSSIDTCNLVLGIDEYLPSDRIDSDNQFVWFKKFYQRIYKETGSEYLDWIKQHDDFNEVYKKGKPSHMDIFIYGHSLDVTDKDVLSRLIMMKYSTTHIFYHNRESMAKQISNLVKVIGEDNLIRKTGGKERTIKFIPMMPAEKSL